MSKHFFHRPFFYLFLILASLTYWPACKPYYHITQKDVGYYTMDSLAVEDTSVTNIILSYKEKLSEKMNMVIGYSETDMDKSKPEGLLNNFVADAILSIVQQTDDKNIDFAISNYGGMRIPNLAKGDIAMQDMFELMPFENMLVVLDINGKDLETLFHHIAGKGGWPVSKGVQLNIKEDKATAISIHGEKLIPEKTYRLVTSDYIANGGDSCSFLKDIPRKDTGILFRNALIQYVEAETKAGRNIHAQKEGRIVID